MKFEICWLNVNTQSVSVQSDFRPAMRIISSSTLLSSAKTHGAESRVEMANTLQLGFRRIMSWLCCGSGDQSSAGRHGDSASIPD
jgi:hypothetical protein